MHFPSKLASNDRLRETLCVHCATNIVKKRERTWTTISFNLGCKSDIILAERKNLPAATRGGGRMYLTADGKMYAKHLLKRVLYCRKFCSRGPTYSSQPDSSHPCHRAGPQEPGGQEGGRSPPPDQLNLSQGGQIISSYTRPSHPDLH